MARFKTKDQKKREAIAEEAWPGYQRERWPPAEGQGGWFKAPRTLPVILQILKDKSLRGPLGVGPTYIELLARVWDDGVVAIRDELEHAMLVGFPRNQRGLRAWRDRMKKLRELGLIKVHEVGQHAFGYVLMVNPYIALRELHKQGKLSDNLWQLFKVRWIEADAEIPEDEGARKLVSINGAQSQQRTDAAPSARRRRTE